jgi:cathepsin L
VTGSCSIDSLKPTAEVELDGYIKLPANDYDSLLHAVATVGPVAVAVAANDWHKYESGIFTGCDYSKNIDVNHVVVLEGYGTDEALGDYWLIRNSWGTGYGENGYIRLARESVATCGIDHTPLDG